MTAKYCVYVIRNKKDDKKYVGYSSNFETRMNEHRKAAFKNCKGPLYDAIRKDGWENFEKTVIQFYGTIEAASNGEKYWVEHHKTQITKFGDAYGYNIIEGGLSDKFIIEHKIRFGEDISLEQFQKNQIELPLPPKLKWKEFKKFTKQPYVKIMKKEGYQILRTKRKAYCKKCQSEILPGTYSLWKKGDVVICAVDCVNTINDTQVLEMQLSRKCPFCLELLTYKKRAAFKKANKNDSPCSECKIKRKFEAPNDIQIGI